MKTYLQENIVNFKSIEKILKLLIYFIPISLILGNAIVNINSFLIILILLILVFSKKNFLYKYRKIFLIFLFFSSLLILNIILSVDQYSSIKSFLELFVILFDDSCFILL